jgi:tetratricopeptide (TPR) repeat protein
MKSLVFILVCFFCTFPLLFAQKPATWRKSLDSVDVRLFLKDTSFAFTIMNRVVTAVPDSADAWYSRAILFSKAQRWEEAIEDCKKALARKEQWEYFLLKSEAEQSLKQLHNAIKTLSAAIVSDPDNEIPYYYRGLLAQRLHDVDNAILDFSDAIMIEAHFPEAYLKRSMAHITAKHTTEAAKDLDSCIALDPSRAEAYFLRGSVRNVIEIKAQLFFGDLYVLCGSSNLAFQASDPL